jgi:hypothetical protein
VPSSLVEGGAVARRHEENSKSLRPLTILGHRTHVSQAM